MRLPARLALILALASGGLALMAPPVHAGPECPNTKCSGDTECTYNAMKKCSFSAGGTECTISNC
jgi:hypothetical protein